MNRSLLVLLIIFTAVLGATNLKALDKAEVWNLYREGESSFRQANELLAADPAKARDLFEKAAMHFEAIHREGGIDNGRLFYNIGNIYFRLGDTGKAILNYRRAERFIPNDVNLQQNLNYARSRCVDKIELKPQTQVSRTIFFWHYDLSGPTRSWLFAAIFGLLWVFAGMYVLKRKCVPTQERGNEAVRERGNEAGMRERGNEADKFTMTPWNSWLRYAIIGSALLSLLLAGSLGIEAYEESNVRSGVILEQEVIGRKGDSTTFEPTFKEPLHTGAEFKLVEERKGWLYIELADGRRCWIPESAAGII
jgi:tetratricopeptide (TPR) repeat protein